MERKQTLTRVVFVIEKFYFAEGYATYLSNLIGHTAEKVNMDQYLKVFVRSIWILIC